LYATDAGSDPVSDLTKSTPIFSDHFSNCSIAAALKVSQAENKTLLSASLNIFPIFPIVVVFPTPFTPDTKITFCDCFFSKKFFFF